MISNRKENILTLLVESTTREKLYIYDVILLSPFDFQDEMIIAVVIDTPDSSLRVLFIRERDEGETSRDLFRLVLGQERTNHFTEWLEQLLEI